MLRAALAALVALALAAGEADAAKLPPAAQAAIDKLAKAVEKIDAEAAKQRSAERQKTMKELEKVQQTVTKSGDLDGALAVKSRLDELKKAEESAAGDLLGDEKSAAASPLAKQAVGMWSASKTNGINAQIELREDRSAKASWGPLVIAGTWLIEKERLLIRWGGDPAKWESLVADGPDRMVGDSHDAGKDGITMTRVRREGRGEGREGRN